MQQMGWKTTTATRNIDGTRKTWKWVIGESVLTEVPETGPGDKCEGGIEGVIIRNVVGIYRVK